MPVVNDRLLALFRSRAVLQTRARDLRLKPAPGLAPKLPLAAERNYERALVTLVKQTQIEIINALTPLFPGLRADAVSPEVGTTIDGLRVLFAQILGRINPADLARLHAGDVDRHVKKQLARLLALSPEFADLGGGVTIDAFIQQNTLLIRDLVFSQLTDIRAVLDSAALQGLRVEAIGISLAKTLGTSVTRATLIARDQTLSLNGQLVQARQQNLGVTEYIWDTSLDERVREDHKRLHGTRQQWATPPITDQKKGTRNHPGGDILCRCQAIPVIVI